jgi:ACS family glucarate transporter-like MFS transporter
MTRRAYAIIITCFFTVSLAYGIRYAYGMLLPEMLPALGISKTKAGTIFAVYFLVYTVCTPVMGTLSDLFNYRLLVPLFTGVLATGALLMAYADGFLTTCLIFSIAGLGNAACWAPVAALVSKWVPDHKRGTALSFVTMGVGLGIILWGTLIPVIVSAADWRVGWLSLGFFGFGVAALNFALVRNPEVLDRPQSSMQKHARDVWITYKSLFKNKTFWIIGDLRVDY